MWRLTRSTSCDEIDDLVLDLKERLTICGDTLEMIVVDDCCHIKNFYHRFFPNIPVKLDIFHAVQRIIKTLPKGTIESLTFSKEVGLVFRKDGDVGQDRMFPTPDPECIESNLEQLLFKWKEKLPAATLNAIENVRQHVRKGCLSGIPPSVGTTLNERLHRHLKRSMLCGASSVSPELAIPILALVLYVWTCRRRGLQKHTSNQRVIPIIPFEFGDVDKRNKCSNGYPLPFKCLPDKDVQNEGSAGQETDRPESVSTWHSHYQVANVNDLLNVVVVNYVVTRLLQINDCWNSIKNQTPSTVLSMLDIFGLERCFMKFSQQQSTEEDTPAGCNLETLERNLASFGLTKVSVVGDGNCCFRSIIKCLHHSYLKKTTDSTISYVLFLKSLGFGKTEEEDAMHLRYLMCQEILSKSGEYQQWLGLTAEQLSKDVNAFREQGWFNSDAGDIAVKVCSNILEIPIIVVTSYPQASYQSFVPPKMSSVDPLYVAFNHSPPGHYDATTEITLPDASNEEGKKYCQCGKQKKNKQMNDHSCTYSGSQQCSCLSSGRMCSRRCQCYNCCNPLNNGTKVTSSPSLHRCRCGRGSTKSKGSNKAVCRDWSRKSKCPCLKSGVSCSSACQCLGCGNPHNQTTRKHVTSACSPGLPKKRKRSNPDPYKRKGGSVFLSSQGFDVSVGPWKDLETLLLLVVYELLEISNLHENSQSIVTMYNFVADSSLVIQMKLDIATKRSAQIIGKLLHVKGRHNILKELMNNK
ncbi:uncharacterized protein LOC144631498 isoform X2 [Oculina patagonica]